MFWLPLSHRFTRSVHSLSVSSFWQELLEYLSSADVSAAESTGLDLQRRVCVSQSVCGDLF